MSAKRVDVNQPEIVADLRAIGATVEHLHEVGDGCPDILVGWRGGNYLFEIKKPASVEFQLRIRATGLTVKQQDWHDSWNGQVDVIRTSEEAFKIMGISCG